MGSDIQQQWEAVKAAPILYIGAVVAFSLIVWAIIDRLYRHRIDGLKEELDRERRENARLRDQASPSRSSHSSRDALPKEAAATSPFPKGSESLSKPQRLSDLALEAHGEDILLPDNITPAFLFGLCKGKTAIQCEGAVAVYMGKRLQVSGTLFAATKNGSATSVSILPVDVDGPQDIFMIFEDDRERLSVMQEGDLLSATGRLTRLGYHGMQLADCRLL